MRVPGLHKDDITPVQNSNEPSAQYKPHQQTQLTNKKVWKLKKYSKTDDEIKEERRKYEDLEFSTKNTSVRRPRNKSGTNQEFVFVDLSPKKKIDQQQQQQQQPKEILKSPKKQGSRVSRLFRLTSSQENIKDETKPVPSQLMSSPDIRSASDIPPLPKPSKSFTSYSPTSNLSTANSLNYLSLKRSYTTLAATSRYENREFGNSSTSLIMTINDSGRAVLQPQAQQHRPSISASSSTSDLFSLTRVNSTKQSFYSKSPIPSPKRMESPLPLDAVPQIGRIPTYNLTPEINSSISSSDEEDEVEGHDNDEDEDDQSDAFKAFSKIVKKNTRCRKRANTNTSITSISSTPLSTSNRNLTRNHSISSISSVYTKTARISPSRANLLRQATTPLPTPDGTKPGPFSYTHNDDDEEADGAVDAHSYFEDVSRLDAFKPSYHHKKQDSISVLGPALGSDSDSPLDFMDDSNHVFPSLDVTSSTAAATAAVTSDQLHQKLNLPSENIPQFDTDEFFDFNAFFG